MQRTVWMIVLWVAMASTPRAADLAPLLGGAPQSPATPLVSDVEGNAFVPLPQWPANVRPPAKAGRSGDPPSDRKIQPIAAEKSPPPGRGGRHAETCERCPERCRHHVALKPTEPARR